MENILQDFTSNQIFRLIVVLTLTIFLGHMAIAAGMVPGLSGYAKSDNLYRLRLSVLNDNYVKSQQRVCEMLAMENREAVGYATRKRAASTDEIIELTGREPQLPTCDELGIDLNPDGNR